MAPWRRRPGESLEDVRRRGLLDGLTSFFRAPQPPPRPKLDRSWYRQRTLADDMRAVERDFDRGSGREPRPYDKR